MRWLKFAVYLGLVYVVLALSLPRTEVWVRLVLGPAGWVPDAPNPFFWPILTLVALLFVVGLVADVGLNLWKVPAPISGLMVLTFGVALLGFQAEQRGRFHWASSLLTDHPSDSMSRTLERMQEDLASHYMEHRLFPRTDEELETMLAEGGALAERSPYLYRWLQKRPPMVRVSGNGEGPMLRIEEDVLPGTVLYSVASDGQAYWLTAVAGEGAPARAKLLAGAGGRPVVKSNVPFLAPK